MSIATTCPNCKALFRLPDELAGKTVKCQKCASMFIVPSGDAAGTHAGIPLTAHEPAAPEPAAPPPTATVALPPEPPAPTVLLAASEREHVQDGPSKPAPPEKSERRRPSEPKREPAKSGSSMMPFVLALVGLGLFLCLGCAGVSAVWFIGGTEKQPKKDGVVKFRDKKDGFKDMDKKDGFQFDDRGMFDKKDAMRKDMVAKDGFKPIWNPKPAPPLPPPLPFKGGKLPPPPPLGPPGSMGVVFGPDGIFSHIGEVALVDPRKLMDPHTPGREKENKRYKLYVVRMEAGHTYEIDLISLTERFDAFLYLHDDMGREIAWDDDGGGFPHARIIYTPPATGIFHIDATYFRNQGDVEPTGNYRLVVSHVK